MMTIDSDVKITINLSEWVNIRAVFLQEEMTEGEIEDLANELRLTLTWDTLYGMVDDAILDYLDRPNPNRPHYGETAGDEPAKTFEQQRKNAAQFEMVDLVSPSWTIQVPRRKSK